MNVGSDQSVVDPRTPKLKFLPRLEAVRGLAAVSVVGYHAIGQFIDTNVTGMAPVVMFFVLSGFVLARSLTNDPRPFQFFRQRIFRLLPAATVVVLFLTLLHLSFGFYVGYQPNFDPLNVALNTLMVRHDINGVMWSMTVECFATPLILASVWIFHRWGPEPLWWLIALLFALSFWGPYVHLLGGFTNLAPLYAFVIGVLLQFRGETACKSFPQIAGSAVAIAATIVLCACGAEKQTGPLIALECISSAMLVVFIAFQTTIGWFRVLDLPIIRFYGRISYSFYLFHLIGLSLGLRLVELADVASPIKIIAALTLAIAITTPMAWLSWRLVEQPFVALGKTTRPPVMTFATGAKREP
jgi:exopolysaccharide production protein ExoZ